MHLMDGKLVKGHLMRSGDGIHKIRALRIASTGVVTGSKLRVVSFFGAVVVVVLVRATAGLDVCGAPEVFLDLVDPNLLCVLDIALVVGASRSGPAAARRELVGVRVGVQVGTS